MRLSTARAAASDRRAIPIASSTSRPHGWKRSRSGGVPRYSRSRSGSPVASSSAVWRAIAHAASTVRSTASVARSEVLALPRHLPKYTVMPGLVRLYSTADSPWRTVTIGRRPRTPRLPRRSRPRGWRIRCASRDIGHGVAERGRRRWDGPAKPLLSRHGRRRFYQQDAPQTADEATAGRGCRAREASATSSRESTCRSACARRSRPAGPSPSTRRGAGSTSTSERSCATSRWHPSPRSWPSSRRRRNARPPSSTWPSAGARTHGRSGRYRALREGISRPMRIDCASWLGRRARKSASRSRRTATASSSRAERVAAGSRARRNP